MFDFFRNPELVEGLLLGLRDGLAILDKHGAKVFVNDALCQLTGFTREELIGASAPFPYWPPEEYAAIGAAFQRTLAGDSTTFDLVFLHKNGERFPVLVSPSVLRGKDGSPVGYVATVKDISERKRLENAVVESEQRWRSIAENPFDFVVVIDRDYRYVYVNHTAPGISHESLIGKATPFDFTAPEHHAVMREAFEIAFNDGRAVSYEVYVTQLDQWFSTIVGPIREQGQITSISCLTREITAQKRAEEALRRSEHQLRESHKMETVGTLAVGIAHDLNNILTPILAHSDLVRRAVAPSHALQPSLVAIYDAALRARDLVKRILLFSRRQEPQKQVIDLGARIHESVKLFTATLPTTISITLDLPSAPLWVLADHTQIDQVLANLATNAHHAMRDSGGRLCFSVREVSVLASATDVMPPGGGGRYAALAVTDSGVGMDEETQRRAFDPFFTTKPTGSGTGLGLSIVHGIVREHGGDVTVFSAPGKGATFTVRLPITEVADARPAAEVGQSKVDGRRLRVLCVDDELAVAQVVQDVLESCDHHVTVLTNPVQALDVFRRDPHAFDLLITDQTMPQMRGTELIAAIRSQRPELPCVLMTGFDDDDTIRRARDLGVTEILTKPFLLESLEAAVHQAGHSRE